MNALETKLNRIFLTKSKECRDCAVLMQILDLDPDPLVIVNREGDVVFMNQSCQDYLQTYCKDVIGKPLRDIIPDSRLQFVCSNNKQEIGQLQKIKGKTALVHRCPLVVEGEAWGAMKRVVFRNVAEVKSLYQRLLRLDRSSLDEKMFTRVPAVHTFRDIHCCSTAMNAVKNMAQKVAPLPYPVLLQGEVGTGKELFAQAIHSASPRRYGPFISVNCKACPQEILTKELFGYEEVSARNGQGMTGVISRAEGGTLFLKEIGEIALPVQAALLRILQKKPFSRNGGSRREAPDLRIIAASSQDLLGKVKKGQFIADLYYRLNTFTLELTPLRRRPEDVPLLAQKTLERLNAARDAKIQISPDALKLLQHYAWPGNVRELVNLIERLALTVEEKLLEPHHIQSVFLPGGDLEKENMAPIIFKSIDEEEKKTISWALTLFEGNKTKASRYLGIHRSSLYRKMQKYKIK